MSPVRCRAASESRWNRACKSVYLGFPRAANLTYRMRALSNCGRAAGRFRGTTWLCYIILPNARIGPCLACSEQSLDPGQPECRHSVQYAALDDDFDLLVFESSRRELRAEHSLESRDCVLRQALPGAGTRNTPSISTLLLDSSQSRVSRHTPRRRVWAATAPRVSSRRDCWNGVALEN